MLKELGNKLIENNLSICSSESLTGGLFGSTLVEVSGISKVYKGSIVTYQNEVKTSLLNDIVRDAVALHEPPSYKGRRLKIYFVNQEDSRPPKFTFHVNSKGLVHFSYERY